MIPKRERSEEARRSNGRKTERRERNLNTRSRRRRSQSSERRIFPHYDYEMELPLVINTDRLNFIIRIAKIHIAQKYKRIHTNAMLQNQRRRNTKSKAFLQKSP